MQSRPSPLLLLGTAALGILALAGAGCRGGGSAPTPVSPDPTAIFGDPEAPTSPERAEPLGMTCNHEYFPLRQGYHIQYRNTYPAAGGTSGVGLYAQNVRRVTPTSVYLTSAFATTGGGPPIESNVEYRCVDGGLRAVGYVDTGTLAPGGAAFNNYRVTTNRAEGEFFPRRIAPGSSWNAKFNITMKPRDEAPADSEERQLPVITMDVDIARRAVGIERVVVPAGTYEAMKIVTNTLFDGVQVMSGTEWWVKDVGMVKSTVDAGSGTENIITEAMGVTVPR
jgi:hypothetical protein